MSWSQLLYLFYWSFTTKWPKVPGKRTWRNVVLHFIIGAEIPGTHFFKRNSDWPVWPCLVSLEGSSKVWTMIWDVLEAWSFSTSRPWATLGMWIPNAAETQKVVNKKYTQQLQNITNVRTPSWKSVPQKLVTSWSCFFHNAFLFSMNFG